MNDLEPPGTPTRRQWAGFWGMIFQQTQNAFNDKAAQFLIIPLGGAIGFAVETPAAVAIALPYVLFAPLAGWTSDRFSKRTVMLAAGAAQVLALVSLCGAVAMRNMAFMLLGFFILAVQSSFYGPAKMGINKELVGSRYLGFATGIQQMTTILAILAGQIIAGWVYDHRYTSLGGVPEVAWQAAWIPLLVLTALAVPGVAAACIIPKVPAQGTARLHSSLMVSHFRNIGELWRDPSLRLASLGVAFFWSFAAFINMWSVKLAKFLTAGQEGFGTWSSIFMTAASLGMAAGFGTAAFLLRRRIDLGWVPVAAVGMTVLAVAVAFAAPGGAVFLVLLALLAFVSAVFLAPLNAWMQDRYPAAKRGELQAAANLQDCLAMILTVLVVEAAVRGGALAGLEPGLAFRLMIGGAGVVCGGIAIFSIRRLPAHFIRVVGLAVIRLVYRIRIRHEERVPREGGVLLVPNHVTFADAFFISAACPRPVRFVMDEAFMANRRIRWFADLFETVTIRRGQAREGIALAVAALKEGDVVCLFPEGQLTRTGTLSEIRRGLELIVRKGKTPALPVWCAGAWGSVFSFERGRFFGKKPYHWPYPLMFAYGRPIPPGDADIDSVRQGLLEAAASAIEAKFPAVKWRARVPKSGTFPTMDPVEQRRIWINGYQIGQVNALKRREPFHMLEGDPLIPLLPGLSIAYPDLFRAPLVAVAGAGAAGGAWVGGDALRRAIEAGTTTGMEIFYDFSASALDPLVREDLLHCPCLALEGKVVAMNMPDPPMGLATSEKQPGRKTGTWGRLLPGWYLAAGLDGCPFAYGPSAPEKGLRLPPGTVLGVDGFLGPGEVVAAAATEPVV